MQERILFIDAYDSFTNNIISLLEEDLGVEVVQIKIDTSIEDFPAFLKTFSAVVAGPGPGNPAKTDDIGLVRRLWHLEAQDVIPVLGICLGFQSLVLAFGGRVEPLAHPKHGIEAEIISKCDSIFRGNGQLRSVQYHSLYASLGHDVLRDDLWKVHHSCPDLQPLAWECEAQHTYPRPNGSAKKNPAHILMGVKHVSKPFYGIQFHPESICSCPSARKILAEWWVSVREWYEKRPYQECSMGAQFSMGLMDNAEHLSLEYPSQQPMSVDENTESPESHIIFPLTLEQIWKPYLPSPPSTPDQSCSSPALEIETSIHETTLVHVNLPIGNLNVPTICDLLGFKDRNCIVLDSEMRQQPVTGHYSIIGVVESESTTIQYRVGSGRVECRKGGETTVEYLRNHGGTIFSYLKNFLRTHKIVSDDQSSPFWGGLMGLITYEACLETLGIGSPPSHEGRPDIIFAFVERSIVIDHMKNVIHIQSIQSEDKDDWVKRTLEALQALSVRTKHGSLQSECILHSLDKPDSCIPSATTYKAKIRQCQQQIKAGNSYELCLTTQTIVKVQRSCKDHSWSLYLRLRSLNPAPFSAFIRFDRLTLLSTSPERFMSWRRPVLVDTVHTASTCQFRPIKGTVQKRQFDASGRVRTVDVTEATQILSTTKERAENLMIVDLIRHDLHGVVGPGNVTVKQLMVVEEYESVFQLVSVIEGTLINKSCHIGNSNVTRPQHSRELEEKTGIDVLASSLPPGSMTGAPKRRSCQILQDLEYHEPRSAYSGVLGYMCVGGGGDFSVVIRSMYRWDDATEGDTEHWNIGAGGAVTGLSTEDGEWEEMMCKMESTMRVFGITRTTQ